MMVTEGSSCFANKARSNHKYYDCEIKSDSVQEIKLDLILDYNLNKIGVDQNNQLYSYYPFQRKEIVEDVFPCFYDGASQWLHHI